MSSPDRQPVSDPPPAAPLPAALRPDGREPRSRAQRLLMLGILTAISLSVAIPALVVTGLFGQRPRPKTPAAPAHAAPAPGDGLLDSLQRSAIQTLPDSQSLGPDPITVLVRPEHVAARLEKVRRQAAQFGGTATDGVPEGNEKLLFVDLPAAATAAFRLAVQTNAAVAAGSPAPTPTAASGSPAISPDHVEVIIRPAGNDD